MEKPNTQTVKKTLPPAAFQTLFVLFRMAVDIGIAIAIPIIAFYFRFEILGPKMTEEEGQYYIYLPAIFTASIFYFNLMFGTYKPVRGRGLIDEIFGVVKVCSISTAILLVTTFFFTRFSYSRMTVLYSMIFSYVLLGLGRGLVLLVERSMLRRGHGHKRLLLVGTGPNARILAEEISRRPELGFTIAGYLEEEPGPMLDGVPLLGEISEVEKICARYGILEIILALKTDSHEIITPIVDLCDRYGIECLVSPDLEQMILGGHHYDEIAGIPVMRVKGLRMRGFSLFIKRAFDLVISVIVLIIISPILIAVAILIRIDSPGPTFYMQKRVGTNGEEFWMYKFRSMRVEAEGGRGPAWSKDNDPRVTRLGDILRKLSIDELPQLFNVVRGDMSLVGPRPERSHFVEIFNKSIPRYMERHSVKTGMTGWAQVNGLRGDTSIKARVQYDLYYIENWSIWFDFKICILTIVDIFMEMSRHIFGGKKKSGGAGPPQ